MKNQRKLRNLILPSFEEFGVSTQIIISTLFFTAIIAFFTYYFLTDTLDLIIEVTNIQAFDKELLSTRLTSYFFFLLFILFVQFTIIIGLITFHTHRFFGASFAIKKYIENSLLKKEYGSRLILRKGDYLVGIADLINSYSEIMNKDNTNTEDKKLP